MKDRDPLRLLVVSNEPARRAIEDAVRLTFGEAEVRALEPQALMSRDVPMVDCAIASLAFGEWTGSEVPRALRAAGFEGGLIVVAEQSASGMAERMTMLGVHRMLAPSEVARELGAAIAEVVAGTGTDSELGRLVRRSQRLLAAGEIALGLQHALNNPLTALLAEAQLLAMEPLPQEQAEAAQRMVDLCRRMASIVRQLEVVKPDLPRGVAAAVDGDPGHPVRARTSHD